MVLLKNFIICLISIIFCVSHVYAKLQDELTFSILNDKELEGAHFEEKNPIRVARGGTAKVKESKVKGGGKNGGGRKPPPGTKIENDDVGTGAGDADLTAKSNSPVNKCIKSKGWCTMGWQCCSRYCDIKYKCQ